VNDLQIAKDLRSAADYLRTHGWRKGSATEGSAPCLGVALQRASGIYDEVGFAALGFTSGMDLIWWNDAPERTFGEVLGRLESTALALEVRALATESVKEESVVESSIPQPVASAV
jgi:hypothetical protein